MSGTSAGPSIARHIAIVGAGVGGMVAAIRLAERGHQVTVFDPAPRAGGLAGGIEVGGGSVEMYYHHLFRSDVVAQAWIHDMRLGERLEFLPASMGFYSGGRLYKFGTPVSLLRFGPLPLRDRIRLGLRIRQLSTTPAPDAFEHVTAVSWIREHASRRESEVFWDPLLKAKFGPDRERVSMAWLWARFRARAGGAVWKPERLGYLRGGFQQLGDALAARAGELGVDMRLGTRVNRVVVADGQIAGVDAADGTVKSDAVLWTPSLSALARAVPELPREYAERCAAIRYHHAVVVLVQLDRSALPFYWVTIGDAGVPFTVAVEQTRMIPSTDYGGRTVIYLGRYAPPDDPIISASDDEVREQFLGAAAKAFSPQFATPVSAQVFRAPGAQPVVPPGWEADRPELRTGLPGLVTANMAQIYPWDRGINYSIELGEAAVSAVEEELAELGTGEPVPTGG